MHKHVFILVALNSLFISVNAGEFYTSERGNSVYVEKDKSVSWYDAIDECASRNMRLITPDTEKMNLEITKLMSSLNLNNRYFWTSGQEADNNTFVWNTTGNIVTYTNWYVGEPDRDGGTTQCIEFYKNGWRSVKCIASRYIMCVEHPIVKETASELEVLKIHQSVELNKMKSYYENETSIKLEELKQLFRNETQELTKVNIEQIHALKNEMKRYYENEMNSKLEDLKKLHESYRNNLLDEMHREISVLKTDFDKQLDQLTLANKIQEIEMLKTFHAKELRLQEEKYNYTLNSLKSSCDILTNLTKQNEQ